FWRRSTKGRLRAAAGPSGSVVVGAGVGSSLARPGGGALRGIGGGVGRIGGGFAGGGLGALASFAGMHLGIGRGLAGRIGGLGGGLAGGGGSVLAGSGGVVASARGFVARGVVARAKGQGEGGSGGNHQDAVTGHWGLLFRGSFGRRSGAPAAFSPTGQDAVNRLNGPFSDIRSLLSWRSSAYSGLRAQGRKCAKWRPATPAIAPVRESEEGEACHPAGGPGAARRPWNRRQTAPGTDTALHSAVNVYGQWRIKTAASRCGLKTAMKITS